MLSVMSYFTWEMLLAPFGTQLPKSYISPPESNFMRGHVFNWAIVFGTALLDHLSHIEQAIYL